jgi:hypothetical protein
VYVHRSGRTARANQTGTAVSLVAPEDALHHRAICQYLGFKSLPLLQVDLYSLPMLRQRVALAKQVRMVVHQRLLGLRIPNGFWTRCLLPQPICMMPHRPHILLYCPA